MNQILRIKVRNCISKNTFRYVFEASYFQKIWQRLEAQYGQSIEFGFPNLRDIHGPSFLIRSSLNTSTLTLFCKPTTLQRDIDYFHEVIGLEEKAG